MMSGVTLAIMLALLKIRCRRFRWPINTKYTILKILVSRLCSEPYVSLRLATRDGKQKVENATPEIYSA